MSEVKQERGYTPRRESFGIRVLPECRDAFERVRMHMNNEQGTVLSRGQVFERLIADYVREHHVSLD